MSGHDAEQATDLQSILDRQAAQLAYQVDGHAERLREMVEARKAAVQRIITGEATEPAPIDTQGQVGASAAGSNAPAPGGPGPGHFPLPPQLDAHAADLERARWLADMPMSDYAARRAELGVQSPTDLNRLFGQEKPR